jgi:hypothetical protein
MRNLLLTGDPSPRMKLFECPKRGCGCSEWSEGRLGPECPVHHVRMTRVGAL